MTNIVKATRKRSFRRIKAIISMILVGIMLYFLPTCIDGSASFQDAQVQHVRVQVTALNR